MSPGLIMLKSSGAEQRYNFNLMSFSIKHLACSFTCLALCFIMSLLEIWIRLHN